MMMIPVTSVKRFIIQTICSLFAGLFIYAAVSKILDFENFKVQLGQSPLISAYADIVSWAVIATEIIIAFFVIVRRTRTFGLFASLGLMTMFTAYIFLILNFGSFIPCSCGGILEKMSWKVHFIFNIVFVILALVGIFKNEELMKSIKKNFSRAKLTLISVIVISLSSTVMIILFFTSETIMHKNNPFIRRYPQHPVEFSALVDIKYNSHYIAGISDSRIYMGNYQYPAYILSFDHNLKKRRVEKMQLDLKSKPFRTITVNVRPPYFYITDGTVPVLLRGKIKDWKITKDLKGIPYFTKAVIMDSLSAVIRSNNSKNAANVIAVFNSDAAEKISYKRALLEKQKDGIFDTDGMLLYSSESELIVYLYYYRNAFFTADKRGTLLSRGNTIDTISHVSFKVSKFNNGKSFAISSPREVVNAKAAVYKNLLFVHSKIKGRYENEKLWNSSFIIDVYDLKNMTYRMSFPIYHTSGNQLNSLMVSDNNLYALIGTDLVVYKVGEILKREIK
ncbi:DoxX family protein [Flavobacterium anhuiense]|uniref:DoxX family protein n=1 Tax=Flavobacterium anhuiense TaxID=459526 RepID=UPI003D95CAAD